MNWRHFHQRSFYLIQIRGRTQSWYLHITRYLLVYQLLCILDSLTVYLTDYLPIGQISWSLLQCLLEHLSLFLCLSIYLFIYLFIYKYKVNVTDVDEVFWFRNQCSHWFIQCFHRPYSKTEWIHKSMTMYAMNKLRVLQTIVRREMGS